MPFPLVDLRKDYNDVWKLVKATETIVVPNTAPYVVRLKEIPDNGNVSGEKPNIPGLTRTTLYPPESGTFYVNYRTGTIVFNVAQKGQTFNVTYWKIGSIIQCSDINYLFNSMPRRTVFTKNSGLYVPADSNRVFHLDNFGDYALVFRFECSQLTGNPDGPYTIEIYDSTNTNNLLYRAEYIVPREDDPFVDRLPFFVEDVDLTRKIHCKIYNHNISQNATFSISLSYLRFYRLQES